MAKKYVLIKNTKEKLEVLEVFLQNGNEITKIKNTKGQKYNIPTSYLITYDHYLYTKTLKKLKVD